MDDWHVVRQDAASREDVVKTLGALTKALKAPLDGGAEDVQELATSQLPRRLLGLLRSRMIRLAGAEESTPEVASCSRSATPSSRSGGSLEPNWDQRFADRLTGPDGLELVVELAHDLRSPLTSILFLGETMKRGRSGPVTALRSASWA